MSQQLKKLNAEQIQKLLKYIEVTETNINKHADHPWPQCVMAVGVAEAGLKHLKECLKGEWPL